MDADWVVTFLWIAVPLLLLSNLSLLGRNERARQREQQLRADLLWHRAELHRLDEERAATELVVRAVLDQGDDYSELLSLPELVRLALNRTGPVYRERKP